MDGIKRQPKCSRPDDMRGRSKGQKEEDIFRLAQTPAPASERRHAAAAAEVVQMRFRGVAEGEYMVVTKIAFVNLRRTNISPIYADPEESRD